MLKLERLSSILDELSTGARAILVAVALLGVLSGAFITGKAVIRLPQQMAQHDSVTRSIGTEQTKLLRHLVEVHNKMLCIQVADHRRTDWTACLLPDVGDDP